MHLKYLISLCYVLNIYKSYTCYKCSTYNFYIYSIFSIYIYQSFLYISQSKKFIYVYKMFYYILYIFIISFIYITIWKFIYIHENVFIFDHILVLYIYQSGNFFPYIFFLPIGKMSVIVYCLFCFFFLNKVHIRTLPCNIHRFFHKLVVYW